MVNSSASCGANLCQLAWVNGLPCIKRTGGPLPPCTVTMRAPLVLISRRVKFSNMYHFFSLPVFGEDARGIFLAKQGRGGVFRDAAFPARRPATLPEDGEEDELNLPSPRLP